ncbi:MAG: cupin domain-containing protein [Candidatus Omnitrophica bacterium]|nr:cupin domain-containing protein [Candidatus Omnitrophota bacterium]
MSSVKIETNPSQARLDELGVKQWPIWTCDVSEFDWHYDDNEICYFLEGAVVVKAEGREFTIKKDDLAFFPKGLKCRWKVTTPVRKYYKLG